MKKIILQMRQNAALFSVVAFLGWSSLWAQAFEFTNGNILIGFRQPGGTEELVVNLGSPENFANATPGSTIVITNFSLTTLNSAFSDLSGIHWSVFGAFDQASSLDYATNTEWATRPRSNPQQKSLPWVRYSSSIQASSARYMLGVGANATTYASKIPLDGVFNSDSSVIIDAGDPLGYEAQMGTGNLKGSFLGGVIEATTPSGFSGTNFVRADFYYIPPSPPSGNAIFWGYFEFDANGTVSFTASDGAAPTVTSVSPTNGALAGGTLVTVNGANFFDGISVLFGGVPATTVNYSNSTLLTAVAPAGVVGPVTVTALNPDGQSGTLAQGFIYNGPAPVLLTVSPTSGSTAGSDLVTLTGSNFGSGLTVFFGGIAASGVHFSNSMLFTAYTPTNVAGTVDVKMVNPDGQSFTLAGAFTYTNYVAPPPPALLTISPSKGTTAGGDVVTLTGSNFVSGLRVSFGGMVAPAINFSNSMLVTAVTPASTAGAVDVKVVNPDSQSSTLAGAFTYTNYVAPPPPPALLALSPTNGTTAGGDLVTLTGSNFVRGLGVLFGSMSVSVINFSNSMLMTVVTPSNSAGAVDVTVINPDAQYSMLTGGFTYTNPVILPPPPVLLTLSPTNGTTAGGDLVTLTGSNFVSGLTVFFGGIAAPTINYSNSMLMTAATPTNAAGPVDVKVVDPYARSFTLAGGFTYTNLVIVFPPPLLLTLSPTNGTTAGGNLVTLTGSNFVSGLIVFFGGIAAPAINYSNATLLTAVAPTNAAGTVDVKVVNPDAQSSTLTNGYNYTVAPPPPPPAISSVTRSGANLVLVCAGATNGTLLVLTTTNLSGPATTWLAVATNTVSASGLSTNTIPINPAEQARFYLLSTPF